MNLTITDRAANLRNAIHDIVVTAKRYEKTKGQTALYLNIGDPIKYDWKTPEFMISAFHKALRDGANYYAP
ncbi:MAG: hypothetical protein V3V85_01710 [Candidatus Thorarchaeota archaeon]